MTIRKLIEAVEQGTLCSGDFVSSADLETIESVFPMEDEIGAAEYVSLCMDGSIDAAKALMDAVLPDWSVLEIDQARASSIRAEWMVCIRDDLERIDPGHCITCESNMLSRAWLLAILRALEATQEPTP